MQSNNSFTKLSCAIVLVRVLELLNTIRYFKSCEHCHSCENINFANAHTFKHIEL